MEDMRDIDTPIPIESIILCTDYDKELTLKVICTLVDEYSEVVESLTTNCDNTLLDEIESFIDEVNEYYKQYDLNKPFPEKLRLIAIGGRPKYYNTECILVLANDWESGHSKYCLETYIFLLPSVAWNTIVSLKNNHLPWVIDWEDFEEEYLEKNKIGLDHNPYLPKYEDDEDLGTGTFVHRHKSIPNHKEIITQEDFSLNQIGNWQNKLNALRLQYLKEGWSDAESLRDYVSSMAEGNSPDFFSWLFDDSSLQGCSIYEIPNHRRIVFQLFLQQCKPTPEN